MVEYIEDWVFSVLNESEMIDKIRGPLDFDVRDTLDVASVEYPF